MLKPVHCLVLIFSLAVASELSTRVNSSKALLRRETFPELDDGRQIVIPPTNSFQMALVQAQDQEGGRSSHRRIESQAEWAKRIERHDSVALIRRHDEASYQEQLQRLNVSTERMKQQLGPCGFGKNTGVQKGTDKFVDGERQYEASDERAVLNFKQPKRVAFAAMFLWMLRGITDTSLIPIHIEPRLASHIILAQYGIVTAEVPKACFDQLRSHLEVKDETSGMLEEVKQKKPELLKFIEEQVTKSCAKGKPNWFEKAAGNSALKALHGVRYGYWKLEKSQTATKCNSDF
jgi:hypothetical protein